MYIQTRNRPPRVSTDSPSITSIRELSRFVTTVNGEVHFESWSNDDIRLRDPPSDHELRALKIDLNQGFEDHWLKSLSSSNGRSSRGSPCGVWPGMNRDDVNRKTFEAMLKYLQDTDYFKNNVKPSIVATAAALHLLLQLPYEDDERNVSSWLVTKYKGILFLFSIENFYSPSKIAHSSAITSEQSERSSELGRYRSRSFFNLMTEKVPFEKLQSKTTKCLLNEAKFAGHSIVYSAVVNAVNSKDEFVDLRLVLSRRSRRDHLEKLQRLWSIAVWKPSTEIVLGFRSIRTRELKDVPDGRLTRVERVDVPSLPNEVLEFSEKNAFDRPLWRPEVAFDFLQRVIEYLNNRVMDDPKTVYQLIPEGFYGRGFSLLSIHKLNTKGCDPLIPLWFLQTDFLNERHEANNDNGRHPEAPKGIPKIDLELPPEKESTVRETVKVTLEVELEESIDSLSLHDIPLVPGDHYSSDDQYTN